MTNAIDWLPAQALEGPPIQAKFSAAVDAWASAWFPRRQVRVSPVKAAKVPPHADAPWRRLTGAVSIACAEASAARICRWALDASEPEEASDADRRLLDALTRRVLDDLGRRVDEAFAVPGQELPEIGRAHV